MTRSELQHYRDKLQELARRLHGDVTGLRDETLRTTGGEASGNLSNAPMHPADLGTDNFEHETNLGLLALQGQTLVEVGAALDHIRQGTYGKCQECGQQISRSRLEALPYTPYCIECAHEFQQRRGPLVESLGNL
jgi:RNA polymerase-binding transcription factor DksA